MARRSTILLVEDNPDDVELTRLAFEKVGIDAELVVVHDGVEALDYLLAQGRFAARDRRDLPTLVLLDLNLPRLGGIAVLERIRTEPHTKYLPVVILTSSGEERDVDASYRNWVNSYVRKPVNFREFEEVSKQLGIYWTRLNVAAPEPKA